MMGFQLFDPIGGKEKFFKSILYHELKLCTTTQTCCLQNDEFLNMEYKSYCLTKHVTDNLLFLLQLILWKYCSLSDWSEFLQCGYGEVSFKLKNTEQIALRYTSHKLHGRINWSITTQVKNQSLVAWTIQPQDKIGEKITLFVSISISFCPKEWLSHLLFPWIEERLFGLTKNL